MEDLSAFSARPRLAALLNHFAEIVDTRQGWKVMYPLCEVLFLVVCGTIASGDDYDDIVDWSKAYLTFLPGTYNKPAGGCDMRFAGGRASEAVASLPVAALRLSDGVISSLPMAKRHLVGSTGKFEPFVRETQPDQFMSLQSKTVSHETIYTALYAMPRGGFCARI